MQCSFTFDYFLDFFCNYYLLNINISRLHGKIKALLFHLICIFVLLYLSVFLTLFLVHVLTVSYLMYIKH